MLKYRLKKIPRKKAIVWTTILLLFAVSMFSIVRYYASYSDATTSLGAGTSGTDGTRVIVNDLESDWNYYMGLNYTELTDKISLPTYSVKYNESNLVAVHVVFDGRDINHPVDNNYKGTVSNTETEYIFEYFKYIPKNSNNTVTIELIDNPFTKRPNGLGFNGWVCNQNGSGATSGICNGSVLSYDDEYYTRYITVNLSGATTLSSGEKAITIYLNASWTKADIRTSNPGNFNDKGMKNIDNLLQHHAVTVHYQQYEQTSVNHYEPKEGYTFVDDTRREANNNAAMNNGLPDGTQIWYSSQTGNNSWSTYTLADSGTICSVGNNNRHCRYYYVYPSSTTDFGNNYNSLAVTTNNGITEIQANNYATYLNTIYNYEWVNHTATNASWIQTDELTLGNMSGYYYNDGDNHDDEDGYYSVTGTTSGTRDYKLIQFDDSFRNLEITPVYNNINLSTYNTFTGGTPNVGDRRNPTCSVEGTNGQSEANCKIDAENYDAVISRYYYLVTRDTNIYNGTTGAQTVPMTVEGGTYTGTTVGADLAIVNSEIDYTINASNHNFKIGRGVTTDGDSIYGGAGNGSNMKVIVESGTYYEIRSINGTSGSDLEAIYVYGSDYDRVRNDNDKMTVTYQVSASKSGSATNTGITPSSRMIVKSGRYGTAVDNSVIPNTGTSNMGNVGGDSYYTYGIYVGALNNGSNTAFRTLTVEGGQILFINGGPCIDDGYNGNVIGVYVKGGTIVSITGGAGVSRTYGNRIISVTGGHVTNQVAGGSNSSVSGGSNPDAMYGSTLVHIGGNAVIGNASAATGTTGTYGNSEWFSNVWFDVSPGSVYGGGLGRDGDNNRGVVNNSHVIISGGTIYGNVFGGGNYGAVGYKNTNNSTVTVDLVGGTVNGSVYGGGNNAGSGNPSAGSGTSNSVLNKDYHSLVSSGQVMSTNSENRTHTQTCNSRYGCSTTSMSWGSDSYGTVNTETTVGEIPAGKYLADGTYLTSPMECNSSVSGVTTNTTTWQDVGNWTYSDTPTYGSYPRYTTRSRTQTRNTTYTCRYYDVSPNVTYHSGDTYNSSNTYMEESGDHYVAVIPELSTSSSNNYKHTITVNLNGGTVLDSIYGGSNASGTVYGNVTVNLIKGKVNTNTNTVKSGVYGGGFGTSTNVLGNTSVTSNTTNDATLLVNDVYGGSSQGTVNEYGSSVVTINGGTFNDVYGGGHGILSHTPSSLGNVTVNISNGVINNAFNGNNILGRPNGSLNINVSGGTIGNVFGGSNGAGATAATTNVAISGGTIGNVFGGGNKAPTTGKANVNVTGGLIGKVTSSGTTYGNVYAGGNEATVDSTELTISGGTIGNAFGGGNEGTVTKGTVVQITGGTYKNPTGGVFGGGNKAAVDNTKVNVSGGTFDGTCSASASVFGGGNEVSDSAAKNTVVTIASGAVLNNVYGGSNVSGDIDTTQVNATAGTINCNLYGGGLKAKTDTTNVNINGTTFAALVNDDTANAPYGNAFGGGQAARVTASNITLNGSTLNNVYGGSNQYGLVSTSNVNIQSGKVANVFGGNNAGGATTNTKVTVDGNATITNVFGGSNGMGAIIGNYTRSSSNAYDADVDMGTLSQGSTLVEIKSGTVDGTVYGGGNKAIVVGNTTVNMYGGTVNGHIFGGGNEAHIGTPQTRYSVSQTTTGPVNKNTGIFDESSPNSNNSATVNIVNGTVKQSVFGSGNIAFVHGKTYVNIGKKALDNLSLEPNSSYKITVEGNIFGGSYSDASEDDSYSYSSIGVGGSTNVNIDSTDYYTGSTSRIDIDSSIYGEGNNSSVTDKANIVINNFGTKEKPANILLIARATDVKITDSVIELKGDRDKAQYLDKKKYSFVTIDKLYLLGSSGTNSTGTTLYLAGGGKELKNTYSGYFDSSTDEFKKQSVSGRNPVGADNRIYMAPGKVLYVSTGAAYTTAPGYVNGIAFLGMFHHSGNTIETGIYSPDIYSQASGGTVGDTIYNEFNPDSDFTYVYGSKYLRGDNGAQTSNYINIHEDGFYSNYVDADTRELTTDYVGVTEGNNYYEWVIGNRSLEIEVYLEASKYSMKSYQDVSIRLSQLSGWKDAVIEIRDVSTSEFGGNNIGNSNTTFITELVPKTDIPIINEGTDPVSHVTNANRVFGLTMGTTTDGWLSNYSTDILGSAGTGDEFNGDNMYYYDSTDGIRDLSFWLYSSKNIDLSYATDPEDGDGITLGVVNISAFARQLNSLEGNDASYPITIKVYISLTDGDFDGYGFNIAPGKKYNSFASRPTTINSDGSFSIYQSLSMDLQKQVSTNDTRTWKSLLYGQNTSYQRFLKSGVQLPAGTRITMLDLITNEQYFYTTTGQETQDSANNYIYALSDFVSMSNVSGNIKKYSDDLGNILTTHPEEDTVNRKYYNAFEGASGTSELQTEEFIFTVDFSSVANMPSSINSYLYMEIVDTANPGNPDVSLATGNPRDAMAYSVVSASDNDIETTGGFLNNPSNPASVVSSETYFNIYRQSPASLYLNTKLNTDGAINNFTDTVFDDYKLGANLTFKKVESDGTTTDLGYNVLEGLVVNVNGIDYSPETDGTLRLALAGRISTVSSTLRLDFSKVSESEFEFGKYQVCVDPFGSYDGLYAENDHDSSSQKCFNFELLNDSFGIDVTTEPVMITHDVLTGEDSDGNRKIVYKVKEVNGLAKPRLKVSISRLDDHDNNDYSVISYTPKDLCDFVTTISVQGTSVNCSDAPKKVYGDTIYYDLGTIAKNVQTTYNVEVTLKEPTTNDISSPDTSLWRSGTYKVTFSIFDGEVNDATLMGSDYEYLIIRKLDIEELVASSGSGG